MKRLLTLLTLTLCVAGVAMAQSGLHVGKLFTLLRGNPNASVTCV